MPEPGGERDLLVQGLEFDGRNRSHFPPGLTEDVIWEIWVGDFRLFVNPPNPGRSGTHLMIGDDAQGRVWTVVLLLVDDEADIWRPITGWPSSEGEEAAWLETD